MVAILSATVTGWKSELGPNVAQFWDGLTPWRFIFVLSIGYLVWWWVDRSALKRSLWLTEAKGAMDSYGTRLEAVIATHETALAASRADWARQLRELIEDAVQYKANDATLQAEAKARSEADAVMNQNQETLRILFEGLRDGFGPRIEKLEQRIKNPAPTSTPPESTT